MVGQQRLRASPTCKSTDKVSLELRKTTASFRRNRFPLQYAALVSRWLLVRRSTRRHQGRYLKLRKQTVSAGVPFSNMNPVTMYNRVKSAVLNEVSGILYICQLVTRSEIKTFASLPLSGSVLSFKAILTLSPPILPFKSRESIWYADRSRPDLGGGWASQK